jgi:hypothetical protein
MCCTTGKLAVMKPLINKPENSKLTSRPESKKIRIWTGTILIYENCFLFLCRFQKTEFHPDSLIISSLHISRFLSVKVKTGLNDKRKLINYQLPGQPNK